MKKKKKNMFANDEDIPASFEELVAFDKEFRRHRNDVIEQL